jgi:hypothetical protein
MDLLGASCTMSIWNYNRLLKNPHLLRFPCPSSLRRTPKYASLLRTSGALHLGIFEQPGIAYLFSDLMNGK